MNPSMSGMASAAPESLPICWGLTVRFAQAVIGLPALSGHRLCENKNMAHGVFMRENEGGS